MSVGEKQHYTLTLIKKLFDNLPTNMTIGLFCLKYQLLDDAVLHHITFVISVFHTYSYQWACQIIYHPHKCEGFGLSDGEGCERLWSVLKHLIAPLHVSGVSVLCFEDGCIQLCTYGPQLIALFCHKAQA
ncbi:hypothetical protein BD769DRAFT_1625217 [Suillus cothurnatus]|nr:hypothetical protein BD769DRAFT_1625217 [Suillus cothurnatus]